MKAIDEVWEKNCNKGKLYSINTEREVRSADTMEKEQFEKAVKELLEMQREECERAYCHRPKWDHDIAVAILNAEIE